ncbi:MAG TPA: SapB/AmfS family lanthipeptide [Micromonosporaceae bacterium]|nr:SapB/AmfS family lanthipeptide [Micromonosporaceae bacterium]
MALLDLQGMETPAFETSGGSSASGHSCGSDISVTLCGGHGSELSVVACGK